jgi:hypothetical protein
MDEKKIGSLRRDQIPPRVKIKPRPDREIDMSTPEAREEMDRIIHDVINTHRVAIKALAKR